MSTDTILYLLLALTAVNGLVGARFSQAIRGAIKAHFGTTAVVYLAVSGIVTMALWISLAVATGYWQFAAITVVGFLINHATTLAVAGREDAASSAGGA